MPSDRGADTLPTRWAHAITELSAVPSENWTSPFLALLPVTGMAVSTLGTLLASETLYASDAVAGRLDELQFDLGEGPCWDAVGRGAPVLEPDIAVTGRRAWPAFTEALGPDVHGLFAFPLLLGPIGVGAIDLYSVTPEALDRAQVGRMQALATAIGRLVMHHAISRSGSPMESEEQNPHSRRVVHQATGAVAAQLDVSTADALLVLQGRAFADGRSVKAVADDVIARRMLFARRQDGTEETP